jgi:aerobic carbon-monoxide dehydrogenase medium subunit
MTARTVHHYPTTIAAACAALAGADAGLVYGGGTSVQIMLKHGTLAATDLIDLGTVPGLDVIRETATGLRVGALVTLRRMETDPLVRAVAPLAAEVYRRVAHPRIRNTATVGGNLADGDHRLDPPPALMVLDARVELVSPAGTRAVGIREFFVGPGRTALACGEIITAIEIPRQPAGSGGHFEKFCSLAAGDRPCASVAALAVGSRLRLGLGALAPTPVFTEIALPPESPAAVVAEAARAAAGPLIKPIPDARGSAAYKTSVGLVAVATAATSAWANR